MQLHRVLPGRGSLTAGLALALVLTLVVSAAGIAGGNGSFQSGGGGWSSPLTFFGVAIGVGNNDLLRVTATADGSAPAICRNKGGNIAPGQVGLPVQGVASGTWTSDQNGKASGETDAILPEFPEGQVPSAEEAGCPNRNWTVIGLDATRVDWDTIFALATKSDGGTFDITLVCSTNFRADGTTFGQCVEQ